MASDSPDRTAHAAPYAFTLVGFPRGFAAAMVANLAIFALLRLGGDPPWAADVGVGAAGAVASSYRPHWWARPHRAATLWMATVAFVAYFAIRALWRL
jgi:hypothetical protein